MIYFDKDRLGSDEGKINFIQVGKSPVYRAKGKFGSIIMKEIVREEFTIIEISLNVKEIIELTSSIRQQGVYLTIPLKGFLSYAAYGLPAGELRSQCFNLFFSPHSVCSYKFQKGRHSIFSIHFSIDFLTKWKNIHKNFSAFINDVQNKKPVTLCENHKVASGEMLYLASDLFTSNNLPELYAQSKILQLLRLVILQSTVREVVLRADSSRKRDEFKLLAAKKHIQQNLKRPGLIDDIAKKVGFKGHQLKRAFREVFGISVFEFITEERMNKAVELLEKSRRVDEFYSALGYAHASNFTNAFTRYFGHPPTAIKAMLESGKSLKLRHNLNRAAAVHDPLLQPIDNVR